MSKVYLKGLPVYVYIDASNIKNALKTFNIDIDFLKLYQYFMHKYSNLIAVKYFEGIDKEDIVQKNHLKKLEKAGYIVKSLERKTYLKPAKYKNIRCINCGKQNKIQILKETKKFKSNIDVYLCSELMGDLLNKRKKFHAIILSCDGDYAEMIKNVLNINNNIYISVLDTPFVKNNNYLSVRLKELRNVDRYQLVNILNIGDKIKRAAPK